MPIQQLDDRVLLPQTPAYFFLTNLWGDTRYAVWFRVFEQDHPGFQQPTPFPNLWYVVRRGTALLPDPDPILDSKSPLKDYP